MSRSINVPHNSNYRAANVGRKFEDVIEELEERVQVLENHLSWDEHLRMMNPALQDLYLKFQATKKLIT